MILPSEIIYLICDKLLLDSEATFEDIFNTLEVHNLPILKIYNKKKHVDFIKSYTKLTEDNFNKFINKEPSFYKNNRYLRWNILDDKNRIFYEDIDNETKNKIHHSLLDKGIVKSMGYLWKRYNCCLLANDNTYIYHTTDCQYKKNKCTFKTKLFINGEGFSA